MNIRLKHIGSRERQLVATMAIRTKQNKVLVDPSSISTSVFQVASLSSTASFASSTASASFVYTSPKRRSVSRKIESSSVHGLLEAMKDSSPPRTRGTVSDPFDKSDIDTVDLQRRAWLVKHPSALDKFDQIIESASGKRIVMFLDYDGTLSPIVEDPERAFMSDEMRTTVKEIAFHFPTAIITGRSREKVYEFVQLPELYYAGSHGMDIRGPAESCNGVAAEGTKALDEKGNAVVLFQPASEFALVINEVFKLLDDKAKKVPGAQVEHNKFCVTVHFRRVKEENWVALAEQVQNVLQSYPNLCVNQGRKILEIRPSIAWNKGKALEYLLKSLGLGNRSDVFPIYMGDDQTDEDAFKVLSRKKLGLAVLVSSIAKETNAVSSLRDPGEVLEFLRRLVKWKRRRLNRFT